tara:strand:+ start:114 stop:800 length:687 start_codon:yes stop_codon:yes gene_type:complete
MLALKLGLSLNNIKTLGGWNPDDEASLVAWYKNKTSVVLSGSNVSKWGDSSTNTYNMQQGTSAEQPTYDAATGAVTFDGSDDNLQLASGAISLAGDFTIGMKVDVDTGLGVPLASNTTVGEFFRFTSTTELRVRIDNATAVNMTLLSGTWGAGNLVVTRTSGNLDMYWKGVLQTSGASPALGGTADIDALGVRRTDLNPFDGDLFDVQVYSSSSAALTANVNSYLDSL